MPTYSPGNPFAPKQYSPGNPFAPKEEEKEQSPVDPFQAMIDTINTKDDTTLKQLGTGFMDPFHGAAQLIGKGVDAVAGRETEFSKNISDYQRQREADYKEAVPQDGFDVPRAMGTAANPAMWLGPKKVQIGGRVLKGAMEALGKHTSINALQSMAMPVDPDEDYWETQKGRAAFGALIGNVLAGTGSAVSNAQKFIASRFSKAPEQATRYLKEMFGTDAPEVARQLDNLSSKVPGEKPTVGWLSTLEEGRWPQMAAIENEARAGEFAGLFNQRDIANQEAQVKLFNTMNIGGNRPLGPDNRKLESTLMKNARRNAAPFYDKATQELIYVPEPLQDAIKGNEMVTALREGKDVITQAQLNSAAGLNPRKQGPAPIQGREVATQLIPDSNINTYKSILPMESIGDLQTKRKAIDYLIKSNKSPIDPELLNQVRFGLSDRMKAASPNYATGEKIFKEGVAHQNRADYVTALRNKLKDPAKPVMSETTPLPFLKALQDPTGLAKDIGIPFNVDSTEQLMGQGAAGARRMAKINALRESAERDLALKSVYAPQKVKGEFDDIGKELDSVLPPFLSAKITAIKRLGTLFGKQSTVGMRKVIDKASLDPTEMAKLLRAASPEDRNAIMNGLRSMNEAGVRPITGVLRSEMSREAGGM